MQPNQTMVGPIAKQCLEGLGRPPSLWSLETLVNAGIILGFNRSSSIPHPPTHMYTLARARTRTRTLKHAQRLICARLLIAHSYFAEFWCNTSCRGSSCCSSSILTHQTVFDSFAMMTRNVFTAHRWGHLSTERSGCDCGTVWGGSGVCPGLHSINGLQVHPLITAVGALTFSLQLINNTLPFLPREP